jgi:hypothetical protein
VSVHERVIEKFRQCEGRLVRHAGSLSR